jgi:hypothetical protein
MAFGWTGFELMAWRHLARQMATALFVSTGAMRAPTDRVQVVGVETVTRSR